MLDVGCSMFDVRCSLAFRQLDLLLSSRLDPALVAFENMAARGGLSPRELESLSSARLRNLGKGR
jgi:hypothetical protein